MLLDLLFETLQGKIDPLGALLTLIYSLVALMLVFPIHEFAHGLMAFAFGDKTAKYQGRLTLNPIAHIDLKGFLFLLFFGFGWARPVEFDPRNFKNRRLGTIMTAAAGPLSNILCCFLSLLLCGIVQILGLQNDITWLVVLSDLFYIMALYNATFAVFNLIPFPPLDGSKIVGELLPLKTRIKYYQLERYSFIFFIALIITMNRIDILGFFRNAIINGFFPIVTNILEGLFA